MIGTLSAVQKSAIVVVNKRGIANTSSIILETPFFFNDMEYLQVLRFPSIGHVRVSNNTNRFHWIADWGEYSVRVGRHYLDSPLLFVYLFGINDTQYQIIPLSSLPTSLPIDPTSHMFPFFVDTQALLVISNSI